MNIIIYLRSTIAEMRDSDASKRDSGTRAFFVGQSRGIWDGWQVCITAASQLKGKGQEPRMRSEFRKLRDNRAPQRDRGTVDKFAGQSPKMCDAWQLCDLAEEILSSSFFVFFYKKFAIYNARIHI